MKQSIRQLLANQKSLLLPVAHDALTAKLIELSGYSAYAIGGFGVAASSYALPDNGSLVYEDLSPIFRRILHSSNLPALVDADTGYGDVTKAAQVVQAYESAGASAIFIEDQVWPKRCGHAEGHKLVSIQEMQAKIKAAKNALKNQDTILMARTDSRSAEGSLEAAITRAKSYIEAGANSIFIEAPLSLEEVQQIPKELPNVILLINMMEWGKTPLVSQKQLEQWGYQLIAYPITSILAQTKAIRDSLVYLQHHGTTTGYFEDHLTKFSDFRNIINL